MIDSQDTGRDTLDAVLHAVAAWGAGGGGGGGGDVFLCQVNLQACHERGFSRP